MASGAAAMALRESFGDRKIPEISRKITACVACRKLKNEVSGKLFTSSYTFDDVRALCVGTLWLPEVSKALNGLAVRIATELDLHRSITKMPHTKRACYDRTRLYFLVYLSDHHCFLTHGKPPLTRDFHSLKSPRAFLESRFSSPSDMILISQVELWSINSQVFDTFGADTDNCVDSHKLAQISCLEDSYKQCRGYWLGTMDFDTRDHFAGRMFDFYFHSAKFYLFSHVFRGQSELSTEALRDVEHYALRALEHALSIVCFVSCETRECLQQLPYYIGAVTAFASVCLVKASSQKRDIICNKEGEDIITHLHRLVQVLHPPPGETQSSHPLLGIAKGLDTAMHSAGAHQFDHNQHSLPDFNGLFEFDFALDGLDIFNVDSTELSTAGTTGTFPLSERE
ncbi:hypothetical protein N7476_007379 [Penicillium atrosanguineum]|uniref:Transcription factor domain-containing protein n=2 Tax=Penicillium atrosanguineum TaxID=1132637 RepID=A0A9W9PW15_9EURO|nr:hypothetical protein N7476_007379 [Penicillium atrosanguineum]